ncbi:MAG: solute carrier family 23 protein [Eubacteriales bacterium]|nr:solute carrier family 23 protein [Eubacteriales bacterium]
MDANQNLSQLELQRRAPVAVGKGATLAIQHVVAMVVGCITVPIIAAASANLDNTSRVTMIQASLLSAGIAVLIQALCGKLLIGSGLPLMVGSGFAFIGVLTSVAHNFGVAAMFGAQLCAAIAGICFGFLYKYIRVLFTPLIKAIVVMTIGISLSSTAVDYIAGSVNGRFYGTPKSWAIGMFTLIVTVLFTHFGKGFIKLASTLLGLLTGYAVGLIFQLVHFDALEAQPMFRVPQLLPFGMEFKVAAIAPFIVLAVISAVQDMGQIEATTHGLFQRSAKDPEVRGGIIADNIGTLIGSLFGGVPNAIAGQNVGIAVTTGVGASVVFVIAGVILIVIGFFPIVSAAFLTIPFSVLGGATIAVFGSIATTGMKMLADAGMTRRNLAIAGLSLSMAIGITYHQDAFSRFPVWVQSVFGNAIVVATLASIILNLILPREVEQK